MQFLAFSIYQLFLWLVLHLKSLTTLSLMLIDGDWTNMGHTFNENTNVDIEGIENPIEYFKKFFSDEMIQLICDQTNLYSTQSNIVRRSIGTTKGEIERLLAVNFDKLFKLRPLLRSLKRNCLKVILRRRPFHR